MKRMIQQLTCILIYLLCLCLLASCMAGAPGDGEIGTNGDALLDRWFGGSSKDESIAGDSAAPMAPSGGGATGDGSVGEGGAGFEQQAGLLTGAEWNDNDHFDAFVEKITGQGNGWYEIAAKWNQVATRRVRVRVHNGQGEAVRLADVSLLDEQGNVFYTSVTDANGDAYLFYGLDPKEEGHGYSPYSVRVVAQDGKTLTHVLEEGERRLTLALEATHAPTKLDVMFMIDTTGSMGDELEYLKAEMGDVIRRVASESNVSVRTSVNFYRDKGDEYELRYFDFREDIDEVVKLLANQKASGGGDYEEAVDTALDYAVNQARWDEEAVKLMFLVLDAPPHYTVDTVRTINDAIMKAAEKGIRIIPVASSGVDTTCQVLLRTWAVMTGGTYTYLTDHSGIGGSHQKPDVENVKVERLNDMLVRIIREYVEGTRWDLIAPVDPHKYDCEGIEQAVASEIKIAYCKFTCEKNYGGDLRFEPSDMVVIRYEGKIGECHIVMMGGDEIDYADAERVEVVAGYALLFGNGQPVYAYHDGDFYTIGEAYEAGLLSSENVYALSLIFRLGESGDLTDA